MLKIVGLSLLKQILDKLFSRSKMVLKKLIYFVHQEIQGGFELN